MSRLLDAVFDLGPTDDPRRVAVGHKVAGTRRALASTPGARVRLVRSNPPADPEAQKALLWLSRAGVPVELATSEVADAQGIFVDGRKVALADVTMLALHFVSR